MRFDKTAKTSLTVFLLYTGLVFALLPLQPLWLDELMQTADSRYSSLSKLLGEDIPRTAGQVPLAYLLQKCSISWLGYSTFSARLPAALMGVLACVGVYQLAKWANIRRRWLCLALFATLPLQLRYSTEARPYSQALSVAVWLTVVFFELRERQSKSLFCVYTALCVVGLYTQPFTLFILAAHGLYALVEMLSAGGFGLVRNVTVAGALSVSLFMPWYLFAKAGWRTDVNGSDLHFHMHAKLPLEVLRELTGAGYIETLLVLLLCFYGLRFSTISRLSKWFWALAGIVPGMLALFADAAFDYFFAIRQMIFVLPPLIVLTTLGLEALERNGRARLAGLLAVVLLVLNIGYSTRWFMKPKEDWGQAAARLDHARNSGACLVFLPASSVRYYEFYVPGLDKADCQAAGFSKTNAVFAAISPYFRNADGESSLRGQLQSQGFVLASSPSKQEPRVLIFHRR
jgi:uncharacterized membrane protein